LKSGGIIFFVLCGVDADICGVEGGGLLFWHKPQVITTKFLSQSRPRIATAAAEWDSGRTILMQFLCLIVYAVIWHLIFWYHSTCGQDAHPTLVLHQGVYPRQRCPAK